MDDRLFRMSKDEVLAEFLPHLARINPAFEPGWVRKAGCSPPPTRSPSSPPTTASTSRPSRRRCQGLYLANMFQVYPHDRGQNYSVELAERLVNQLEPDN